MGRASRVALIGHRRSAMSTSERLTARAEHDRCARALADAVAVHLVSPTTGNADSMHSALQSFTDARKVLDA